MSHSSFVAYVVGGAVRDTLLGRPVSDRDWVVVGATPSAMLAAGFIPVGRDFPVFLHPQTKEEYALARTERKSGRGHQGFVFHAAPDVTLEEDLLRRDLTINAIAQAADGTLIDPYGGQQDLRAKVLRHVSEAFAEDPLRVLRLARFAARFPDFSIAQETIALAQRLAHAGELNTLTAERVWQELARGLMETAPQRMIDVLVLCDAWPALFPDIRMGVVAHAIDAIGIAAADSAPLPVRYALLAHFSDDGVHLSERLRVPRASAEVAALTSSYYMSMQEYATLPADARVDLLMRLDALRRPDRLQNVLQACEILKKNSAESAIFAPQVLWDVRAMQAIDVERIAKAVAPKEIAHAMRAARIDAIAARQRSAT